MNIFKNILVAGIIGVITLLSGVCVGLPSCYLFTNPTQIKIKDMEANTEEVWKDIKGYEGLYQVSNLGRVKSLDRIIVRNNGVMQKMKGKYKKQMLNTDGYYYVSLYNNSIRNNFFIHRLIALSFIPNPLNNPCINHKNGIKTDNHISNLEWCTVQENNIHAYRELGKQGPQKDKFGYESFNKKPISQFNKNGEYITTYPTSVEASKHVGVNPNTVSRVVDKKGRTAGGYIWKHTCDVNDKNIKYAT